MRPFQIILIGVFAALAVGGLIFFAAFRGFSNDSDPISRGVVMWGTLDSEAFMDTINAIRENNDVWSAVRYEQKDSRTFTSELVNAIAEGHGPDLVVIPNDLIISQAAKFTPIPYDSLSQRDFRDTYIRGAEIFMFPEGIYALPLAVDPLVMYWNRSLFASNGFSAPPATWEELVRTTVPTLTKRTDNNDVLQSAVAFGQHVNVQNAKELVMMLMMQAGSMIASIRDDGVFYNLDTSSTDGNVQPGSAAVRFYTEFSDPGKSTYSWNRSLPLDRNAFLSGDLALYFGFGSEVIEIANGNPNLDFDLTEVPQSAGTQLKTSYGTIYGLSLLRSARNPEGAYAVMQVLGNAGNAEAIARSLLFAPVHRSTLASGSTNPFEAVIYRAALVARGWLDPEPTESDNIMREMIEDVVAGRTTIGSAVNDASIKLNNEK